MPPDYCATDSSIIALGVQAMNMQTLYQRGLKLRQALCGEKTVAARMSAAGDFGEPLQNIVNSYCYGDVWSRPGLPMQTKSLAVVAMTAAIDRPKEFCVHVRGALNNGCTPEEIREVLLLVTMYCGIPAGNEAHRMAFEVVKQHETETAQKASAI
jgi:4-carboxymuconolactone decarboxylase